MRRYVLTALIVGFMFASVAGADTAESILNAAGVRGGLVVHLGCGDGELATGFAGAGPFLVQGLDASIDNVEKTRTRILEKNLSGTVSAKLRDGGRLPYVSGLVNLLVVEKGEKVSRDEIMRALAPGGVAMVGAGDGWRRTPKPRPDDIDDWTHFLHSPGNNAVANDEQVGLPRTLRWECGPEYSRSHEMDVSIAAAVSEGGRLFSILDKGPAGLLGKNVPDKWVLEARDAFSGVLLWERPMREWGWQVWKPELNELDDWTGLIAQRRLIPATLPRRLVAVNGTVYVTFGVNESVTAVDASTGRTIREYTGTEGTDEILVKDGVLLVTARPDLRETAFGAELPSLKKRSSRTPVAVEETGRVMAFDVATGRRLWRSDANSVIPFTLAAGGKNAFFHTGAELICRDLRTGREVWRNENTNVSATRWEIQHILVVHKNVVLLSVPKTLCEAFDAATGKLLWTGKGGRSSAFKTTPLELFVIDDLLWFTSGKLYEGVDIHTGEIKRTIELPQFFHTPGHHLRCYRARATTRYILDNKRGIEFMDLQEENHQKNDWVRGACRYGIIPANGLIYSTPTPCSCYQTVLLKGFNALSDEMPPQPEKSSLVKGPAYGQSLAETAGPGDWPTLRGNVAREGFGNTGPGSKLRTAWKRQLGGKLTQPIMVNDRVYVASRQDNVLYALDAKDGAVAWKKTMAAEVDSPPAYYGGMLFFGCRDGWIYSLRADNGELVWRFRAAPMDRQIVSYGRLESSWPVTGNVLALKEGDGAVVYAAAGRNSYLDGGIYVYGLDASTGKVRYSKRLANPAQDNMEKYDAHEMEGARPDVFVYDGKYLSMQGKVFDRELNLVPTPDASHMYATGGFIDDQAWHRNFWLYTSGWTRMNKFISTFPNVGQLLVHEGSRTYGVKYFTEKQGQSMVFYPEEKGYYLFCDEDNESYDDVLDMSVVEVVSTVARREATEEKKKASSRVTNKDWEDAEATLWNAWIPVRVRAMVKTKNALYVAGPADEIPTDDPMAPFEGRSDGLLWAVNPETGSRLAEYKMDASPTFDGMIAANKNLLISLTNGTLICLR